MIRHLSYVACNCCGDPAQPGADAEEARNIARAEGFTCMAVDLCSRCKQPGHQPCQFGRQYGRMVGITIPPDPKEQP